MKETYTELSKKADMFTNVEETLAKKDRDMAQIA